MNNVIGLSDEDYLLIEERAQQIADNIAFAKQPALPLPKYRPVEFSLSEAAKRRFAAAIEFANACRP